METENSEKVIVFYKWRKSHYDDERAREGMSAASKSQVLGIVHKVIQHYSKNPNPHLDTLFSLGQIR